MNFSDVKIILIENVECIDKDDLLKKTFEHIDFKNNCYASSPVNVARIREIKNNFELEY
jgi:hypothetical protein